MKQIFQLPSEAKRYKFLLDLRSASPRSVSEGEEEDFVLFDY